MKFRALLPLLLLACPPPLPAEAPAGVLLSRENKVLLRRAGASEWRRPAAGQDLYRHDTVYTMAASYAEVRFNTGETLALNPNTLVILRPPGRKDAGAEMLSGELRSRRSRVVMRDAVISPATADAEFTALLKPDFTTVVKVTRGAAEVEARGKKVLVGAGNFSEVKPGGVPSPPAALAGRPPRTPPAPGAAADAPGAALPADLLRSVKAIRGYRLQASPDPSFSAPVLDKVYEESDSPDLSSALPPGDYYVRAAQIDLLGYEGKFSAPKKVLVPAGGAGRPKGR